MENITLEQVQRAVAGDQVALERILRALERPFHHLAVRMMLPANEAEDAAQECLVRVATRLAQFDGASKFSTWAWKVAVRRILDLKAPKRLTFEVFAADLLDGLEPEAQERPDDLIELGELKMACGRAMLQCLDADDRIAFVLGAVLELDSPEAAEILDLEPAAFRKRLSRARERLQGALEASCGLVNPNAACRCHRRLQKARSLGRVAKGRVSTEVPLDVKALRDRLSQIGEAKRAVEYYRADPESKPRRDLVRAALQPLRA
jgi:RNA polymerase sigma factor (sigma-70 family)